MSLKQHRFVFSLIALAVFTVTARAQVGSLRGTVGLRQPDGKEVALADAAVDAFRIDLPGLYKTKTNAQGEFVYAGLPYVGTYVIAVSAPGTKPAMRANVKAGREEQFHLVLEPGDGRRITSEEAKAAAADARNTSPVNGAETLDQLKNRIFRAGNSAIVEKNYDQAIKLFEEGVSLFPQEVAFLANLSFALRFRGLERYNSALNARNDDAREQLMAAAKNDFQKAAESATRATDAIKLEPIPENEGERNRLHSTKLNVLTGRLEALRLVVSFVDASVATKALAALDDYLAAEDDPWRKVKAQNDIGLMLLQSKNINLATEHFRRMLVQDQNNLDAVAGFGLALFETGNLGKASEAGAYLQKFVDEASPDHPMKARVIAALQTLKSRR
ncbi:MAG TPA: carboxypeptidase-like regulatory domain-containing protein [Pyrinomonadaceae bacterium]